MDFIIHHGTIENSKDLLEKKKKNIQHDLFLMLYDWELLPDRKK